MTTPFLCIFLAFLLIPLTKVPVGVAMARQKEGYDNRHPRDQQAALEGWGRRAVAAHNNTIEAFPGFAAAALVAHVGGGDATYAAALAITFVVARLLYPALYLADIDKARSLVWTVGVGATIGLFLLPAFAAHP
jgi:uncharacterized MAPEG superfamily protein